MEPSAAAPNTVPWPPIIYGAAALAAWLLNRLIPVGGFLPPALHPVGAIVMLAGLSFDLFAMISMYRHHANILPHRAATALVTSFPFSVSRNPIYLGNTILLVGAAVAFSNLWFAVLDAAAVQAVTILAIRREEGHLAALFGPEWQNYAKHVPRWLKF
ncbi:MAG: isoprenylcysteine carboxylmethyltransferase family protein [Acidocella sp.]|nr:isoprenylcysteine carboxylmethyltransferase family protein [Acidocella sp.]